MKLMKDVRARAALALLALMLAVLAAIGTAAWAITPGSAEPDPAHPSPCAVVTDDDGCPSTGGDGGTGNGGLPSWPPDTGS